MYSIYHIPTFVYKDGSIGKIGCTHQEPKVRVEEQGYSSFEILETYDCIDSASDREIELQKEYGYKVDRVPYSQTIKNGKTFSIKKIQASCKNLEKATKKNSKPVLQYSIKPTNESLVSNQFIPEIDKFIREYKSTAEAKRITGVHHISCACNGIRKHSGGFIWKWKD